MAALGHTLCALGGDLRMNERVVFLLHGSYTLAGDTVHKHTNKRLVRSGMEDNVSRRRDWRHS